MYVSIDVVIYTNLLLIKVNIKNEENFANLMSIKTKMDKMKARSMQINKIAPFDNKDHFKGIYF